MAKPLMVTFQPLTKVVAGVLGHSSVDAVLPDAVALYGTLDGQTFRLHEGPLGEDREDIAVRMLGPSFRLSGLTTAVAPGVPIFTNTEEAHVASLLLAPKTCQALCAHVRPPATSLLAVFPSETRILWSPIDKPEIEELLRELSDKGRAIEEEPLSSAIVRFDGKNWAPARTTAVSH